MSRVATRKGKDDGSDRDFAAGIWKARAAINPILYCWRLRELRTVVLKAAKQLLYKNTQS